MSYLFFDWITWFSLLSFYNLILTNGTNLKNSAEVHTDCPISGVI